MMKMRCVKCNFELEENEKFCTGCGALNESTENAGQSFCTECGTKIEAGSKFCTGCGALTENKRENQDNDIKSRSATGDCNSNQNRHDPIEVRKVGTDCVVKEAGSQTDTSYESQHTERANDQLADNAAVIFEEKENEGAKSESIISIEKPCISPECQVANNSGAIKPQSNASNDGATTILQAQAVGKYSTNRLLFFAGIAVLVLIFGIIIFSKFGENKKSSLQVPTPNNVAQQGIAVRLR